MQFLNFLSALYIYIAFGRETVIAQKSHEPPVPQLINSNEDINILDPGIQEKRQKERKGPNGPRGPHGPHEGLSTYGGDKKGKKFAPKNGQKEGKFGPKYGDRKMSGPLGGRNKHGPMGPSSPHSLHNDKFRPNFLSSRVKFFFSLYNASYSLPWINDECRTISEMNVSAEILEARDSPVEGSVSFKDRAITPLYSAEEAGQTEVLRTSKIIVFDVLKMANPSYQYLKPAISDYIKLSSPADPNLELDWDYKYHSEKAEFSLNTVVSDTKLKDFETAHFNCGMYRKDRRAYRDIFIEGYKQTNEINFCVNIESVLSDVFGIFCDPHYLVLKSINDISIVVIAPIVTYINDTDQEVVSTLPDVEVSFEPGFFLEYPLSTSTTFTFPMNGSNILQYYPTWRGSLSINSSFTEEYGSITTYPHGISFPAGTCTTNLFDVSDFLPECTNLNGQPQYCSHIEHDLCQIAITKVAEQAYNFSTPELCQIQDPSGSSFSCV